MAELIYALCAITSATCAALLLRGYLRSGTRLLFWSSACFACLALSNSLLFVDLVLVPEVDLSLWRRGLQLLGTSVLLAGLIGESK
jgi:hypothetical protein